MMMRRSGQDDTWRCDACLTGSHLELAPAFRRTQTDGPTRHQTQAYPTISSQPIDIDVCETQFIVCTARDVASGETNPYRRAIAFKECRAVRPRLLVPVSSFSWPAGRRTDWTLAQRVMLKRCSSDEET